MPVGKAYALRFGKKVLATSSQEVSERFEFGFD
jgi:hypothetical protein